MFCINNRHRKSR